MKSFPAFTGPFNFVEHPRYKIVPVISYLIADINSHSVTSLSSSCFEVIKGKNAACYVAEKP